MNYDQVNILEVSHFVSLAKMLCKNRLRDLKPSSIKRSCSYCVAADNQTIKDETILALKKQRNYPVFFLDGPFLTKTNTFNPGTARASVVDMYALATCTQLIATYSSTFGPIAASLGNIRYHVMYTTPPSLLHDHTAWFGGGETSEPCFYLGKAFYSTLSKAERAVFESLPDWMSYTQCHPYNGTKPRRFDEM